MALFGRRSRPEPEHPAQVADLMLDIAETDVDQRPGPSDSGGESVPPGYVDLGSLFVPPVPGMQVRAQFEKDGKTLHRIMLILGTSGIRVSVAAAPRSGGVWSELREQLADSVTQQGGKVTEVEGRYGTELKVQMPVQLPNGSQGFTPMRFIGVEGPRWVVRLDIQGAAAAGNEEQEAACDSVIDQLIVNRGPDPRVRMSLLPLQLPREVSKASEDS